MLGVLPEEVVGREPFGDAALDDAAAQHVAEALGSVGIEALLHLEEGSLVGVAVLDRLHLALDASHVEAQPATIERDGSEPLVEAGLHRLAHERAILPGRTPAQVVETEEVLEQRGQGGRVGAGLEVDPPFFLEGLRPPREHGPRVPRQRGHVLGERRREAHDSELVASLAPLQPRGPAGGEHAALGARPARRERHPQSVPAAVTSQGLRDRERNRLLELGIDDPVETLRAARVVAEDAQNPARQHSCEPEIGHVVGPEADQSPVRSADGHDQGADRRARHVEPRANPVPRQEDGVRSGSRQQAVPFAFEGLDRGLIPQNGRGERPECRAHSPPPATPPGRPLLVELTETLTRCDRSNYRAGDGREAMPTGAARSADETAVD